MISFKKYIIENEQELNIMFQLKDYNNTILKKMDIKSKNVKQTIIDCLNIIMKNLKDMLSGNILFSIVESKLEESDDIIEIYVANKDKKIEIILNQKIFEKLVSNNQTEQKENVRIIKRDYQILVNVIQKLINSLKK